MNKAIIAVIALLIIGGGVFMFVGSDDTDTSTDSNSAVTPTQQTSNQQTSDQQQMEQETEAEQESEDGDFGSVQTVTYNDVGFSPEKLTSKSGEKMIIENKSSKTIQVQSDPHPAHDENDELNIGAIAPGESKSVILTTKGTFGFHNHVSPDNKASVVVQ